MTRPPLLFSFLIISESVVVRYRASKVEKKRKKNFLFRFVHFFLFKLRLGRKDEKKFVRRVSLIFMDIIIIEWWEGRGRKRERVLNRGNHRWNPSRTVNETIVSTFLRRQKKKKRKRKQEEEKSRENEWIDDDDDADRLPIGWRERVCKIYTSRRIRLFFFSFFFSLSFFLSFFLFNNRKF